MLDRRLHGPGFALAPGRAELALIVGDDVLVVDLESGRRETFRIDTYYALTNIAYSPDGQWLAVMEYGNSNPSRNFVLAVGDQPETSRGLFSVCHEWEGGRGGLMFSSDSKLVISTGDHFGEKGWYGSGEYPVWSIQTGQRSEARLEKLEKTFALDRGLARTKDRMGLTYQGPDGKWEYRPGKLLYQAYYGWLTERAVGVRTKDKFTILDGRSGKVMGEVDLKPDAPKKGISRRGLEVLK